MTKLWDYVEIVGRNAIEELLMLADRLSHKSMLHVNSTAIGGGVAEILHRLVPLMNELDIDTRWDVIKGGQEFFRVTKSFHNGLQGNPLELTADMLNTYLETNEMNAREINFDRDVIFIHDPQPAALISMKDNSHKWVWRCHIDLSSPQEEAWNFMRRYINRYDVTIFSIPAFGRPDLTLKQFTIPPSIDPLDDKNRDLSAEEVNRFLDKYEISHEKPIITQVGRFDRFKDPIGVVEVYKRIKKSRDCQLVLAGGTATDDPEGAVVYKEVQNRVEGDPDIHLLVSISDLEVNALQRASSVILQKSLREGFGLTVSESMWKGKPVIGGAVGGIPLQVKNGITGYLVRTIEGAVNRTLMLLRNSELAEKLGENGKEHVKRNFLITRHIRDYLFIMHVLEHPREDFIQL
ncbi:MAG: glycosyltransferase [Candidatus Hydrothermarchaeota archaeon]